MTLPPASSRRRCRCHLDVAACLTLLPSPEPEFRDYTGQVRVADFHFDLPEDRIAQQPPEIRGSSRLLRLDRATGSVKDDWFRSLSSLLAPGDLLVLNDSRVLPARLFATRAGLHTQGSSPAPAGRIEVLLTEELPAETPPAAAPASGTRVPQVSLMTPGIPDPREPTARVPQVSPLTPGIPEPREASGPLWRALVRPARKVQPGETLLFADPRRPAEPLLTADVIAAGERGERTLRFTVPPSNSRGFLETVEQIGHMPLPPYIRRDQAKAPDTPEDRERYQTVYAQTAEAQPPASPAHRSAAAPTAGLHFTPEILAELADRGVEIRYITLHVGLGTFQPVRVDRLEEIRLHAERYTIPEATAEALNRARRDHRRMIAAGTTVTRTLEHVALLAEQQGIPELQPHSGSTSLFLAPGHRFRLVSGLLTNFHLPESTLLMLVSAFAGREAVLRAYDHAVEQRYRFFSYGDAMLIL